VENVEEEIVPVQIREEVGDGERGTAGEKDEVEVYEVSREAGGRGDVGISKKACQGKRGSAAAGRQRLGGRRGAGNQRSQQGGGIDESRGGGRGGARVGRVLRTGI